MGASFPLERLFQRLRPPFALRHFLVPLLAAWIELCLGNSRVLALLRQQVHWHGYLQESTFEDDFRYDDYGHLRRHPTLQLRQPTPERRRLKSANRDPLLATITIVAVIWCQKNHVNLGRREELEAEFA